MRQDQQQKQKQGSVLQPGNMEKIAKAEPDDKASHKPFIGCIAHTLTA